MDASTDNLPSIILRHDSWNLPGLKTQILRSISGLDGSPTSGASEDERLTFEMAEPIATLTMHRGPSGKVEKEQPPPESTPSSMADLFRQFDDPSWSQIINGLFTELPPLMPEDLKSAEFLKLATPSSLGRGLMLPTERLPAREMRNFGLLHDSYPLAEQAQKHDHMMPLAHSSLSHDYAPSAHPCFYPSPTACPASPQTRHQTPAAFAEGRQGSPMPALVSIHVRASADEGADSDFTDEDAPAAKRGCYRQLANEAKPADSNASSGSFTGSDSSRKQRASSLKRAGSTSSGGRMKRQICRNCGTHQTPQWRCGPEGPRTLCNACGVKYKKGQVLVPTADAAQLEAALI